MNATQTTGNQTTGNQTTGNQTTENQTPLIPAIDLSTFSASTLASSSLIANLSISVWTGRKLDKRVSEEVDQAKSTKTRAGNYNKNLMAGSEKLTEINKIASACRAWLYSVTQPWGDNGDRLLPVASLIDFKSRLTDYERSFGEAVTEFLNDYDTLVSAAAFQLGELFNREDYPTRESISNKFAFNYALTPLPQAGDFRVDVGNEGLKQLQEQYEKTLHNRVEGAMREAWDTLYDVLAKMSDRLADDIDTNGDITRKIFRDSLIDNAVKACEALKHFNITNDMRMDEMRRQLEDTLRNVDAQALRDSDHLRQETKRKVDTILSKFND